MRKTAMRKTAMRKMLIKLKSFIFPVVLLFIAPSIFSLILGFEMGSDRIETIPTVIADYDQTEFSRTLTDYIADNDYYRVVQYLQNDQQVNQALISGEALVAVIVPDGLTEKVKQGKPCKVQVFYDGSMMTVVSSAKTTMSEIFMTVRANYLKGIYEGKLDTPPAKVMDKILPVQIEMKTLFNSTRSYRYFLLPGFLLAILQVSLAVLGCQLAWKKRNWLQNCIVLSLWSILGTVAIFCCLGLQYQFFALPYRGSLTAGFWITLIFSCSIIWYGYLVAKIVHFRTLGVQVASITVIPTSVLGGYTFPIIAMPEIYQPIGNYIPFAHYGTAIRNLCLKEEIGFSAIKNDFMYILIFWLIELVIFALFSLGVKIYETAKSKID